MNAYKIHFSLMKMEENCIYYPLCIFTLGVLVDRPSSVSEFVQASVDHVSDGTGFKRARCCSFSSSFLFPRRLTPTPVSFYKHPEFGPF